MEPNPYAFLKVVDELGERDVGLTSILKPNRSIYLGNGLLMQIKQDEISLVIYDIKARQQSSTSISIDSSAKLTYDYTAIGDEWVIAACTKDVSRPDCHFYTVNGLNVRPLSKNVQVTEEGCASKIHLTDQYLLLSCDTSQTITLFQLSGDNYVMKQVLSLDEIIHSDSVEMVKFDDSLSVIYFM